MDRKGLARDHERTEGDGKGLSLDRKGGITYGKGSNTYLKEKRNEYQTKYIKRSENEPRKGLKRTRKSTQLRLERLKRKKKIGTQDRPP